MSSATVDRRFAQPVTGGRGRLISIGQLRERRFLRRLYWTTYFYQVVGALAALAATFFWDIPLLQDALFYEKVGHSIAIDWLNGRSSQWLAAKGEAAHHYPKLLLYSIACFYTLTLGARLLPLLVIIYGFITAYVPGMIYRICRCLGTSAKAARLSAWLVALTPAFAFFSGAMHKEGVVLLMLSISVYQAFQLQKGWRTRSFAILCLAVLALALLRLYMAVIMAFVLAMSLLLVRQSARENAGDIVARQFMIVIFFISAMVGIGIVGQVNEIWPESLDEGFDKLQMMRFDSSNHSDSGYLPEADVSTPAKALAFMPKGSLYFLLVPLPWQTGSLRQNLAIPDTALWLALYPLVVVGALRLLKTNTQAALLLLAATITMVCFYGIFSGNVGTAYRFRIQVWLLWSIFAAFGYDQMFGTRGRALHRSSRPATRPRRAPARQPSHISQGVRR